MKINTSAFVLDYNLSLNKKFYFISGSEITYMEKVKQIVISGHRSKNSFELETHDPNPTISDSLYLDDYTCPVKPTESSNLKINLEITNKAYRN